MSPVGTATGIYRQVKREYQLWKVGEDQTLLNALIEGIEDYQSNKKFLICTCPSLLDAIYNCCSTSHVSSIPAKYSILHVQIAEGEKDLIETAEGSLSNLRCHCEGFEKLFDA